MRPEAGYNGVWVVSFDVLGHVFVEPTWIRIADWLALVGRRGVMGV